MPRRENAILCRLLVPMAIACSEVARQSQKSGVVHTHAKYIFHPVYKDATFGRLSERMVKRLPGSMYYRDRAVARAINATGRVLKPQGQA